MSKVLVIVSDKTELPKSCSDCFNLGCYLPMMKRYTNVEKMKKAFLTKRHPDCPLAFVDSEALEPTSPKKSRV